MIQNVVICISPKTKKAFFFFSVMKSKKRAFLPFAIKINFKSGVNILKLFLSSLPQKKLESRSWQVFSG
jgi:hypothetical protein